MLSEKGNVQNDGILLLVENAKEESKSSIGIGKSEIFARKHAEPVRACFYLLLTIFSEIYDKNCPF